MGMVTARVGTMLSSLFHFEYGSRFLEHQTETPEMKFQVSNLGRARSKARVRVESKYLVYVYPNAFEFCFEPLPQPFQKHQDSTLLSEMICLIS